MTTARKTYVKFVPDGMTTGEPRHEVQTLRGELLGCITYYPRWKQHVFAPEWDTEFSFDCLEDIAAKVKAMNQEAK